MKNLFWIEDTTSNRISYYHLVCFLLALPYDFFYSEIVLISFGIHTLLHAQRVAVRNIFNKPVLIPVSIYFLGLLAVLYSPDKQEAVNVATRQLAIFIFPVLFALTNLDLEKYKLSLMCVFGFVCTLAILYLYADAIRTIFYFHLPMSSLFTFMFMNQNFSLPIKIHATYLSLYTAFSLLIFLFLILIKQSLRNRWIYIVAAAILAAGMIQLSSRAVLIAFLIIINLAFPFFLYHKKKRRIFILTVFVLSVISLVLITQVDSFRARYISELKTDLTDHVKIIENTEPRLARWDAIAGLIKQSPIIGYGSGSEKELLKEKYFEKGLYNSYLNEFNAHNEYLSILIKTGVVGLALFIYVLYFGFAAAIRSRDVLFFSFMMFITIVSLSENLLDLNKGIFFYSFFFSFFLPKAKPEYDRALTENAFPDGIKTGNPH